MILIILSFLLAVPVSVWSSDEGTGPSGGAGSGVEALLCSETFRSPIASVGSGGLRRSSAVVVGADDLDKIRKVKEQQISLFVGIMFHAINKMNGAPGSLLRGGFIPMLCYAMSRFLDDGKSSSEDIEKYNQFIGVIKKIAFDNEKISLTEEVRIAIQEVWNDFLPESTVTLDDLVPEVKSTRLMLPPTHFALCREMNDYLSDDAIYSPLQVQCAFFRLINQSESEVLPEKIGLVHHFLLVWLAKYQECATKTFLWTQFRDFFLPGSTDFFCSEEFLDCISTWTKYIHVADGSGALLTSWACDAGTVASIMNNETLSDEEKYQAFEAIADDQYKTVKTYAGVFMNRLLVAYVVFQQRLAA